MNLHKSFIETPIIKILEEAVLAVQPIGSGIETYPLLDYVMQSVFIKMTGAQEQKLKCIAWELATNDFEFRQFFLDKFNVGFSYYDDKNNLYKKVIEHIKFIRPNFSIVNYIDKEQIRNKSNLEQTLNNTNLIHWYKRYYHIYANIWSSITDDMFCIEEQRGKNNDLKTVYYLFKDKSILHKVYLSHLYVNRNNIAHNTKSFQQNLPALERLKSDDYQYENYFLWFSILILIDEVFMALYKEYLETLDKKRFL